MSSASGPLPLGTRVYNRGDIANREHWGTITRYHPRRKYGPAQYEITPDKDAERQPYSVPVCMVHDEDRGNGLTRIVTEDAYRRFRAAALEAFRSTYGKDQT